MMFRVCTWDLIHSLYWFPAALQLLFLKTLWLLDSEHFRPGSGSRLMDACSSFSAPGGTRTKGCDILNHDDIEILSSVMDSTLQATWQVALLRVSPVKTSTLSSFFLSNASAYHHAFVIQGQASTASRSGASTSCSYSISTLGPFFFLAGG